jgi:predicted alpha/beta-fold hydrolase
VFFETADGGHCSFIGEGDHARWAETQVVNFMRRFADF